MAGPGSLEPSIQRRSGSWKGKLLVVDEDMEDLQHYSAILNRLGYEGLGRSRQGADHSDRPAEFGACFFTDARRVQASVPHALC